jgi:hypothetical protein
MSAIARIVRSGSEQRFAIYHDNVLVANATTVAGLDKALAATTEAGFDPSVYVPGLHVAGLATAGATQWFVAWRGSGGKRDLAICDHDGVCPDPVGDRFAEELALARLRRGKDLQPEPTFVRHFDHATRSSGSRPDAPMSARSSNRRAEARNVLATHPLPQWFRDRSTMIFRAALTNQCAPKTNVGSIHA